MQKLNTALLFLALAVLILLWARPQAGRFVVYQDRFLLDTATGNVVLVKVPKEVKSELKREQEDKERKEHEARERRLRETCPSILAQPPPRPAKRTPVPSLADLFRESREEDNRKECEEWLRDQGTKKALPKPGD